MNWGHEERRYILVPGTEKEAENRGNSILLWQYKR